MPKLKKFLIFLFVLLFCFSLSKFIHFDFEQTKIFLLQFPLILSGIIFIFLYVILTFFIWFGPKDIFRVSSALIFGPLVSTVLVSLGEIGNAVVLFQFSRRFGREYVEQRFHLKGKDMERVTQGTGILGAVTARINPLIPFRLMDIAFGLSAMEFRKYMTVVCVVTPVRVYWLQAILSVLGMSFMKDPLALNGYFLNHPMMLIFVSVYFLSVLLLTIIWAARKMISRRRMSN